MLKHKNLLFTLSVGFVAAACSTSSLSSSLISMPDPLTPAEPLSENFDCNSFGVGVEPAALNVSYYSDIYSRGFAWFTDETVTDTKLYLVESGLNYNADFSNAQEIEGETLTATYANGGKSFETTAEGYEKVTNRESGTTVKVNSHKVHVENLKKNTSYSYKVGSESGWKYGAFTTDVAAPQSVTAIQISDAQTYNSELLTTYRKTVKLGIETAGSDLDFVLYNGDQFDMNMPKVGGESINRIYRYTKAGDVVADFKSMTPFFNSSGNHETTCPYSSTLGMDFDYGALDYKGGNYSYNYGPAHFIVLNSNRLADDDPNDEDYLAQINWLKEDLQGEDCANAEWNIVMLHIAPYSTGDHSNEGDNQRLVERLTPLFSQYHIDLVLQAHDHTYNKTLPYKWDAAGYTTTWDNSAVVNFAPETREIDGRPYHVNPEGTYYVTTGAAGHRAGSGGKDNNHEYDSGVFAEVKVDAQGKITPADSTQSYRNNKYRCEVGTLNQATKLTAYKTNKGVDIAADYKVGDPATACPDGQMFGVLNITNKTLTYDSYLIKTGTEDISLFDTLNIYHE